jgi:DNA-binding CsgD family transcriptional regulator
MQMNDLRHVSPSGFGKEADPVAFLCERRAVPRARPAGATDADSGPVDAGLAACRRIEAATEPAEGLRLVCVEARKLGFDWMDIDDVDVATGDGGPLPLACDMAHARWTKQYFERGYSACDPRRSALARSSLPCIWALDRLHVDGIAFDASPDRLREFLGGMERHGLRSGVFFAVPRENFSRRCCVSLAAARDGSGWMDAGCLGAVLTLGMALSRVLESMPGGAVPEVGTDEVIELTAVQRVILTCLQSGMSDKQIAYELNVSRYNIDYHMRQLRRRFGARNRVQLSQRISRADQASHGPIGAREAPGSRAGHERLRVDAIDGRPT